MLSFGSRLELITADAEFEGRSREKYYRNVILAFVIGMPRFSPLYLETYFEVRTFHSTPYDTTAAIDSLIFMPMYCIILLVENKA